MKSATVHEPRPDLADVTAADVEPRFHVWVSPTDEQGKTYVEIDAKRVFSSPRELHTWLTSCVWKLTSELNESDESSARD